MSPHTCLDYPAVLAKPYGVLRAMGLGLALVVGMAQAQAVTVTLNAIETGTYSPGLVATPDYVTGISFAFGSETRGYLVFDLSAVQHLGGNIVAGTLLVANGYSINQVGPNDPLPLRIYGLPEAHAGNFGIHGGAGTGGNFGYIGSNPATLFASVNVLASDTGTLLSIPVNEAGVNHLAASRGNPFYAYGMKIVKADAEEPKPLQYVFNGSASPGNQVQLVLEINSAVPEPLPMTLLAMGLPLLVWRVRRNGTTARQ